MFYPNNTDLVNVEDLEYAEYSNSSKEKEEYVKNTEIFNRKMENECKYMEMYMGRCGELRAEWRVGEFRGL